MAKRTASTKSATTGRKPARAAATKKAGSDSRGKATAKEVTVDRRTEDRRVESPQAAVPPQLERRLKVNRRRQIDPTTCERDYTDEEVEFMNALDLYKRKSGRMFPTCSEVLEVIRSLGYFKQPVQLSEACFLSRNSAADRTGAAAFDEFDSVTNRSLELVS